VRSLVLAGKTLTRTDFAKTLLDDLAPIGEILAARCKKLPAPGAPAPSVPARSAPANAPAPSVPPPSVPAAPAPGADPATRPGG
jgi:hypothetical protein